MTATRVFSTAAYWVAGIAAVLLRLSPKFGALLITIPAGRARRRDGGALRPDRPDRREDVGGQRRGLLPSRVNQFPAAAALIIGIGDLTLNAGDMTFTGITLGTLAAIVLYHGMVLLARLRGEEPEPLTPA